MSLVLSWADVERAVPGIESAFAYYLTALIAGALPLIHPMIRRRNLLIPLGLLASIALYREGAIGILLAGGVAYAIAATIAQRTRSPASAPLRWRLSIGAVVVLMVLFFWVQWLRAHPTDGIGGSGAEVFLGALSMWTAIRLATFFWEVGSARVPLPGFIRFCLWFLFPFTIAGPVARISEFDGQVDRVEHGGDREPVPRWVLDTAKALVVMLVGIGLTASAGPLNARGIWGKLLVLLIVAPWGFLLQASGFFRSMEVFARPWRIHLQPSFNRPFGRPNISDFWANWNITVTAVFRDYLFYNRWGRRRINVYVNSLVLFVLVGAWHAPNSYWILWGFFHGVGFCVYLWYKQKGQRLRPLFAGPRGDVLARALTYLYVVAAWAVPPQLMRFWPDSW